MHEKIIVSSSIIVDLFYFFQVVVNPWPVTRTWVPAVSVPPAGRPLTREVRRRRLMGPRIWWCFPVTAVAPFEIIWDARPCYPSGCAVSGKEGARPWREKNSLRKKSSRSKMEGCFAVQCAISFQSVDHTQNSSLSPFELPLIYSEIDATSAKLWTNSEWRMSTTRSVIRKEGVHAVNPAATFPRGVCGAQMQFFLFFLRAIFPRESLVFCHFYVLSFPPLISSLILFIRSYYCAGYDVFFWYVRNFFTGSPMGGIKVIFVNFTSRILR